MFKELKLKHGEDHRVFFTGCTHINHDKGFLFGNRGFKNKEEHSEWILNNWNENIREQDTLFHLGDWFLTSTREIAENWLSKVKCKNLYSIWGNHNAPLRSIYLDKIKERYGLENTEIYPFKWNNIVFLGQKQGVWINGVYVVMQHFPELIWDYYKQDNTIHLHSHNHGSLKQSLPDYLDAKRLDIGVDVSRKYSGNAFFTFGEIMSIMSKKRNLKLDLHFN